MEGCCRVQEIETLKSAVESPNINSRKKIKIRKKGYFLLIFCDSVKEKRLIFWGFMKCNCRGRLSMWSVGMEEMGRLREMWEISFLQENYTRALFLNGMVNVDGKMYSTFLCALPSFPKNSIFVASVSRGLKIRGAAVVRLATWLL